ncbi:hypothetical protein [Neptunomonas sp.]|uniref:hypothetical protein n=1 Tax=Neptunomonas sp. TaxID=1971898 RepID=UPI0025D6DD14|nr:hypothetical protein [Neptunomonas sp.]
MTEEEFVSLLRSFSLEQLDKIQKNLELKVQDKKRKVEKRKAAMKVPPRKTSDVEKMADQMGLDLSSLMREISRR